LLWAAGAGHYDAVVLLVSKGANVNATNKNGDTALHRAAWKNEAKVCEFLMSKGIQFIHVYLFISFMFVFYFLFMFVCLFFSE